MTNIQSTYLCGPLEQMQQTEPSLGSRIILIIIIEPVMPLVGGQGGSLDVQLTLFQPGGRADYALHITTWRRYPYTTCLPGFEILTASLISIIKWQIWIGINYSHLPNKRGGWNKRGGGAKFDKSLKVEVGISVEGGILWKKTNA